MVTDSVGRRIEPERLELAAIRDTRASYQKANSPEPAIPFGQPLPRATRDRVALVPYVARSGRGRVCRRMRATVRQGIEVANVSTGRTTTRGHPITTPPMDQGQSRRRTAISGSEPVTVSSDAWRQSQIPPRLTLRVRAC
jgi:hypothetical protein